METFWLDIKLSLRMLAKSPGFAVIAVATLALGMAANTTIFSVVNGIILRPLPVPHAEQLTVLALKQTGERDLQSFSYPDFQDLRSQADAFSDIFAYRVSLEGLASEGKGDHCVISRVSGNYFSALGVQPAVGRLFLPTEGNAPGADPILVLGYAYWQRRFGGDNTIVGKQVELNGHGMTVVGVAAKDFRGTFAIVDMDAYLPLSANVAETNAPTAQEIWTRRDLRTLTLMGRLRPGVSLKQARASLNTVAQRVAEQHPDADKGISVEVFPEKLARPQPDPDNSLLLVSAVFMALADLVLFVACFNIANVLLVRATGRQREMAIRAALGAGRARLIRQCLTESLLLAFFGGGAGLLLASWAANFLSSLPLGTELPIQFDFHADGRVYFFSLAAVLFTGVIVGIIPALRVARTDVNSVLHEGGRGSSEGPRRMFTRNALVVAQVAGSMLLLVVAGLFVRSLGKTRQIALGFNPDHVLNLTTDVQQIGYNEVRGREFYREAEARIRALPGVLSVVQAYTVPMGIIGSDETVLIDGHPVEPGKLPPNVTDNLVGPGYFHTLQIPLLNGRAFTEADTERAPRVAVINQTMAEKFWPKEDPLGKKFRLKDATGPVIEVVGVARDGKYNSFVEDPQPHFYMPLEQRYIPLRTFQVRTTVPPERLTLEIEAQLRAIAPDLPVTKAQTMNEALEGINGLFFFRLGAQLSATMGLLGLTLAVVGVYSVVSFSAAQRSHEIGIRMALGASPGDVLKMILRQGLLMLGTGLAAGLAAALACTRALASLFIGVSPADPLTYSSVAALLAGVALLACWIPARRATRVDPLVALRYE